MPRPLLRTVQTNQQNVASKISPDGTTLYAAGYLPVAPTSAGETARDSFDEGKSSAQVSAAAVWRHVMNLAERQNLVALVSRMDAFQGEQGSKIPLMELVGRVTVFSGQLPGENISCPLVTPPYRLNNPHFETRDRPSEVLQSARYRYPRELVINIINISTGITYSSISYILRMYVCHILYNNIF